MSCEICKKGSCTRSFHSLEVQEEFDKEQEGLKSLEYCEDCDVFIAPNSSPLAEN